MEVVVTVVFEEVVFATGNGVDGGGFGALR